MIEPLRAIVGPPSGSGVNRTWPILCPVDRTLIGHVIGGGTHDPAVATPPTGVTLVLGAGAQRLPDRDRGEIPAVGLRQGAFHRGHDPVRHQARSRKASLRQLTRAAGMSGGMLVLDGGFVWPLRLDTWCPSPNCKRRLFIDGGSAPQDGLATMTGG
jgi:hypothetical protein